MSTAFLLTENNCACFAFILMTVHLSTFERIFMLFVVRYVCFFNRFVQVSELGNSVLTPPDSCSLF
jgi:hypothetical protein